MQRPSWLRLIIVVACLICGLGGASVSAQAASLTTTFAANNGQSGNMFDVVTAGNPITVSEIAVNLDGGNYTIEVYRRSGSWQANPNSAAGWTLIGSVMVTSAGSNNPTPVDIPDFVLDANTTTGLYVTTNGPTAINYTNGTAVGNIAAQNADLQILEGSGKSYPFGGTFQPRVWNGTITYTVGGQTGNVVLAVASEVGGKTVKFKSDTPELKQSLKTVNGSAQTSAVMLGEGAYKATAVLPSGFGLAAGSCDDGDSSINLNSLTATIKVTAGEQVTCTFNIVNSRSKTAQTIQRFLRRRNDMLLSHGPNGQRQINRLSSQGGSNGPQTSFRNGRSGARDAGDAVDVARLGDDASGDRENKAVGLSSLPRASGLGAFSRSIQSSAATEAGLPAPIGFNVGRADRRGASFSTSLAEVAKAAAAAKRRKVEAAAGGDLSKLGIDGMSIIEPQQFGLDFWAEGHIAFFDEGERGGTTDGEFGVLYLGLDYVVSPRLLVGALVQFDKMDELSNVRQTRVEGEGWMIGPYATVRLMDSLFLQTRAAWGRSENDISPFLTYTDEFETRRWLVEGTLQGRFDLGRFAVTPRASIGYIEDKQEAYVDGLGVLIPQQTVSLGQARFGPEISTLFEASDGTLVEPFAELEGIWNFEESGTNLVAATLAGNNDFRGRVRLGFRAATVGGLGIEVSGSYDGIGADDFEAIAADVEVTVPLN